MEEADEELRKRQVADNARRAKKGVANRERKRQCREAAEMEFSTSVHP
jgi:hypothetical protein